jgi:hypothetical protein
VSRSKGRQENEESNKVGVFFVAVLKFQSVSKMGILSI